MTFNEVECPYCKEDNDMDNYLADVSGNETFDVECAHCEESFEVFVEFEPSFSAEKIVYRTCESCAKETRDPRMRGKTYPFPKSVVVDVLCSYCYFNAIHEENKTASDE